MVAATAVDYLRRMCSKDDSGIAFVFCNYKDQIEQTGPNLIAAFVSQLLWNRPDIAMPLEEIYNKHMKHRSRPSFEALTQVLQSVCSNHSTVYLVVDALDECSDTSGVRNQLIDKLLSFQDGKDVRLLFTSRFISNITEKFDSIPWLEVRANDDDVRAFVTGQFPSLPLCIRRNEDLQNDVRTHIAEAADGM